MTCESYADERLQADKMDALYGEADAEVRRRLREHLDGCAACREELAGLASLRQDLRAWRLPTVRPAFTPRGLVVPRWLAAAAALVLGVGLGTGASGYVSLRRTLAEQSERAARLEERQRQATLALETELARQRTPRIDEATLLARVDARIDDRVSRSEARHGRQLADWSERARAERRLDLARVAEGLSYLDGRHGQQLARTNELMSYVLAAQQR
jgi:hypothetical protein